MFGLLRTILALLVLIGHLLDKWQIGTYAVFGFYMISGYLMTCIMHDSYGFTMNGRLRFVLNRFLRLYPLYWCAALLSLLLIAWVGVDYVRSYNSYIFLPQTLSEILANISMIYPKEFANEYEPILVPTTWAITVELFFYAAICLGLSKTKRRVGIWLALSVLYVAYCFYENLGWRYRYFPILAGSLPFAMGAYIYFIKQEGYAYINDFLLQPLFLLLAMLANSTAALIFTMYFEMGFYINALLCVLLCYQIATGGQWGGLSAKTDKWIGEFSYPIYLLQWQAGILCSFILLGEPIHDISGDGFKVLFMALVVVFIIAFLLIRIIDRPVQRWRQLLKDRNR
ncbi:MAG: acyltransferase [Pseudomonadales bacterium]|nr:acyltransferase [Pseudomonadales bacterium]